MEEEARTKRERGALQHDVPECEMLGSQPGSRLVRARSSTLVGPVMVGSFGGALSYALMNSAGVVAGGLLWGLFEYMFHRFAMHQRRGKGIISRTHLEHHVEGSWRWEPIFLANWAGMTLLGVATWLPIGWFIGGSRFGVALSIGWTVGFGLYEYAHMVAHVRPPRTRYGSWLRHHHFHHHFGHPVKNHGVTSPLWDLVFGTYERPALVRVPRRLAMPWLVGDDGELRERHRDRYLLVGSPVGDERLAALDRARAFASVAPVA